MSHPKQMSRVRRRGPHHCDGANDSSSAMSTNTGNARPRAREREASAAGKSPRRSRVAATLPPGIAKRYLPQDLLVQLPPRPGCRWVVVDNDVVLIAAATGIMWIFSPTCCEGRPVPGKRPANPILRKIKPLARWVRRRGGASRAD